MSPNRKKASSKISRNTVTTDDVLIAYGRMLMDIVVGVYAALMLCFLPYYAPEGYAGLGSNKAKFFQQWSLIFWKVMGVLVLCWLGLQIYQMVREQSADRLKSWLKGLSVTEWLLVPYMATLLISTWITEFPDTAWEGTSGWYMGALPQLLAVGAYFCVNRASTDALHWIMLGLPASAGVFLVGFFNRFDMMRFIDTTDPDRLSFIGNINWYCGYLMVWMGFGIGLYLMSRARKGRFAALLSAGLGAYVIICFGTLFTQESSSGLLALAAVVLVLVWAMGRSVHGLRMICEVGALMMTALTITWAMCRCGLELTKVDGLITFLTTSILVPMGLLVVLALWYFTAKLEENEKAEKLVGGVRKGILVAAGLALVLWFALALVNTSNGFLNEKFGLPENNFFVLNNMWGSLRAACWLTALRIWAAQDLPHKLFGVGADCFYEAYMSIGGDVAQYVADNFGNLRLTNAHGELFTVLVNFGLDGLVSFGGFRSSSVWRKIRSAGEDDAATVA